MQCWKVSSLGHCNCMCCAVLSCFRLCATLWTIACQAPCPWDFLGKSNSLKFCTVISCKIPLTSVFDSCLIIHGRLFRFLSTVVSYQLGAGTGRLGQVIALEDKTLAHFSDTV